MTLQCPLCKHNMGGHQHEIEKTEIALFGAKKYQYCPQCYGFAPKARTANSWFKWCNRVDKYLKSKSK